MIIGVNARIILLHRMEGIARYAWETTREMILTNPQDQFILFFDRKYDSQFIIADNVKAIVIPPQARHPVLWKIWFDFMLPYYLKKHHVDVFYSPDGFCSLRTKVPTVLVSHDLAYLHYPETMRKDQISYYKKNVPLFHQKAHKVIAVSHATKDDIEQNFGLDPAKTAVAYNALQFNNIESTPVKKGNYFLYLGSIHPRKNIIGLLKAYEIFRKNRNGLSGPKLIIAGRRAFQNEVLDKTFNSLQYKEDVEFLGMVSEEKKWSLLQSAKAFIYVSLFEGFGIPILEAMSTKTPVICSNNGALKEVADNAAIQVNPEDYNAIAQALEEIETNESLKNTLIQAGEKRIKDFSWKTSAKTIYSCISEAVKTS